MNTKLKFEGILLTAALLFPLRSVAQQTDPTLTAAVLAQSFEMSKHHQKRQALQKKIIAAEATVTVALDRVHKVENKMLDYLANAQGAMQNIYQIKRAAELVAVEIPKNCQLVASSVKGNLKGTVIATLVSQEITDASAQMAALYPFMKQLVTSGSYDVTNADGDKESHKVNLLNSAERYYIANEVVSRLEAINTDLFILAWQIRTLSWNDLWFSLDPEGWASVMAGMNIAKGLIADWEATGITGDFMPDLNNTISGWIGGNSHIRP